MKKVFNLLLFSLTIILHAQIGINKENPKAILDISATDTSLNGSNLEGLLIPNISRERAYNMADITESTVVYINDLTGPQSGKTAKIDKKGFYYFYKDAANLEGEWIKGEAIIQNLFVTNGLTKITSTGTTETIRLGGELTESLTTIGTDGTSRQLAIKGLSTGDENNDFLLTIDENNVLQKVTKSTFNLTIPQAAVLYLSEDMDNYLSQSQFFQGVRRYIPMIEGSNEIPGLVISPIALNNDTQGYNQSITKITFPPGIYQVTLNYEISPVPNSTINCTISSYFVDFPYKNFNVNRSNNNPNSDVSNRNRVHTTASHIQNNINHGGTVSYTFSTQEGNVEWAPNLGIGQSGNCNNNQTGRRLDKGSTQVTIFRLSDDSDNTINFPINN